MKVSTMAGTWPANQAAKASTTTVIVNGENDCPLASTKAYIEQSHSPNVSIKKLARRWPRLAKASTIKPTSTYCKMP